MIFFGKQTEKICNPGDRSLHSSCGSPAVFLLLWRFAAAQFHQYKFLFLQRLYCFRFYVHGYRKRFLWWDFLWVPEIFQKVQQRPIRGRQRNRTIIGNAESAIYATIVERIHYPGIHAGRLIFLVLKKLKNPASCLITK